MTTTTSKTLEFQGTLISAISEEEGYAYQVQTIDPWGGLHPFRESDDLYETEDEAVLAGRDYVDNYEPEEAPYEEAESFRDMMYRIQRLK